MKEINSNFSGFKVSALDAVEQPNRPPFAPTEGAFYKPFPIGDPYNLRKSIVPVFSTNEDMKTYGMGTAFSIDGWGTFITADHVIDSLRNKEQRLSMMLLLGYGLVYGRVAIPDEVFAHIRNIESFTIKKDDPLKIIKGSAEAAVQLDIARIDSNLLPQTPEQLRLPLNKKSWKPKIGEVVFAVGYPELECKPLSTNEQTLLVSEGMYGAFGRIREIHPEGTNSIHPTPVIEIDGTWQSGMSGGPVFNSDGDVIGIVSRSILSGDGSPGIAFATYLNLIPDLQSLIPSINLDNPHWRVGWAIIEHNNHAISEFFISEVLAREKLKQADRDFTIRHVTAKSLNEFVYID